MVTKKQHNEYIKRYRNQDSKHRLELVISPELNERFKALPGLNGKTHAERLTALCEFWEQHHTARFTEDSSSLSARSKADVKTTSTTFSLWDHPLKKVPPLPQNQHSVELEKVITRLYEQEWPSRKHGNSEEAKRWKRVFHSEPAVLKAFLTMTQNNKQLGDLVKHCCLSIYPNDLLAWFSLEENDRQAVLWYLAHTGIIHPEALGQIGERFAKAREIQPGRNFLTWELVNVT